MAYPGGTGVVSISLPRDMITYYRDRAEDEDRPFSTVIRRALETDMMDHAEANLNDAPAPERPPEEVERFINPHNRLVDTPEGYKVRETADA